MLTYVLLITAAITALTSWCLASGFRNGDRPGDARVRAWLVTAAQPDEQRPLVVAVVGNPAGTPAIAALGTRPAVLPAWLAGSRAVSVPRWTVRRKFQPGRYACVGVVPAGGSAEFAVPVPARARRYLLTVAVGQEGGRLRVHRLRLEGAAARLGRDEVRAPV